MVDGEDIDEVFDLYRDLKKHNYDVGKISKLSYEDIISTVYQEVDSETKKSDIKKLFSKNGYTYFTVNYEGNLNLGSPAWCLDTKSHWNTYVENEGNTEYVVIRDDKIKGNKVFLSVPNTFTSTQYQSKDNSFRYGITVRPDGSIRNLFDDNNNNKRTYDLNLSNIVNNIKSLYHETKIKVIRDAFSIYSDIYEYDGGYFLDHDQLVDFYKSHDDNTLFIVNKKIKEGNKKISSEWLFGIVNLIGKIIVPIKYNELSRFYNIDGDTIGDYTVAKLNDKWGIIDKHGKEIIPFKYDYISTGSIIADDSVGKDMECFSVKLGNKWGGINEKGEIIIPIRYKDELQWEKWEKYQDDIKKDKTIPVKERIKDDNLLTYFGNEKTVEEYLKLYGLYL
jgi:hypothetical protein